MADGTTKPIEQIKQGDLVLSRDESSGKTESKKVNQTFVRHVGTTLIFHFDSGEQIKTKPQSNFKIMGHQKIHFWACFTLFGASWVSFWAVAPSHASVELTSPFKLSAPSASPKSTMPNTGEMLAVASPIVLPDVGQENAPLWHSQSVLGKSALALLLLEDIKATDDAKRISILQKFLESPDVSSQLIVASADKRLLESLKGERAVSGTPLLWDRQNTLRNNFNLQKRYGVTVAQSALLIIDRAGWLRRVVQVENATQVGALLKTISDPTPRLEVGQITPDFSFPDMGGVHRRPADLQGKKYLLLTFFPKCFTGSCAKQLESLRNARQELQNEDVEVWGISVDPADGEKGQRAFVKQLNLWFPLLPDTGRHLSLLYGSVQSPNQTSARMSVLIDKQGVVRWIDKQINPRTHGADVVARVRSLSDK